MGVSNSYEDLRLHSPFGSLRNSTFTRHKNELDGRGFLSRSIRAVCSGVIYGPKLLAGADSPFQALPQGIHEFELYTEPRQKTLAAPRGLGSAPKWAMVRVAKSAGKTLDNPDPHTPLSMDPDG